MERKIGEVFNLDDVVLRVEESPKYALCRGCYFSKRYGKYSCEDSYNSNRIGNCSEFYRRDGKKVIFVEVKDNER